MMDMGYQASPAMIKSLQCVLLLTTACCSFRRNKQPKNLHFLREAISFSLAQSEAWLHHECQNDLNAQRWRKVEWKAPIG